MKVEKVTLRILKDLEMFSDTEGKYLYDLAEKLRVFRTEHAQTISVPVRAREATRILR